MIPVLQIYDRVSMKIGIYPIRGRNNWDHSGLRLDSQIHSQYNFEFKGNTFLRLSYNVDRSRLRPKDYSTLAAPQDYANGGRHIYFETNYFKKVSFWIMSAFGDTPNVIPVSGPPRPGFERYFNATEWAGPTQQSVHQRRATDLRQGQLPIPVLVLN